ncbi:hypothetical protein FB567DRAFT_599645 [Paraphoma chrysanthemicola]|uniref:Uncharacterized protein n=1 Tax=Paraphoma chrysanthemicola TaxID=798071 RepID=A0A8K0QSL2_9PLEO|nr:hypothetical protein FB567DRAFT_599645 [Paraphoma chrysanthemicola]
MPDSSPPPENRKRKKVSHSSLFPWRNNPNGSETTPRRSPRFQDPAPPAEAPSNSGNPSNEQIISSNRTLELVSHEHRQPSLSHPEDASSDSWASFTIHDSGLSDGDRNASSGPAGQAPPSAGPMSSRPEELLSAAKLTSLAQTTAMSNEQRRQVCQKYRTMEAHKQEMEAHIQELEARKQELEELCQEMNLRCEVQRKIIQNIELSVRVEVCNDCGASVSGCDTWLLDVRCKDCCVMGTEQQYCRVHPDFELQDVHRVYSLDCTKRDRSRKDCSYDVFDLACGHPICTFCLLHRMPDPTAVSSSRTYKCAHDTCGRTYDYRDVVAGPRLEHDDMQRLAVLPPMGKF